LTATGKAEWRRFQLLDFGWRQQHFVHRRYPILLEQLLRAVLAKRAGFSRQIERLACDDALEWALAVQP